MQHSETSAQMLSYYSTIDEHVERVLQHLDAQYEAIIIPHRVSPRAQLLSCYRNVENQVRRAGGSIQYGWLIVQNSILIEAEHHAVWVNKRQEFIDITPRPWPFPMVVFIPDDRYPYTGIPIDSIRLNKTNDPLVDDLIALVEMKERIVTSASTRLTEMKVRLSPDQAIAYQAYRLLIEQLLHIIVGGQSPAAPCFCKSNKAYKDCHGLAIPKMIGEDKERFPQRLIVFSR